MLFISPSEMTPKFENWICFWLIKVKLSISKFYESHSSIPSFFCLSHSLSCFNSWFLSFNNLLPSDFLFYLPLHDFLLNLCRISLLFIKLVVSQPLQNSRFVFVRLGILVFQDFFQRNIGKDTLQACIRVNAAMAVSMCKSSGTTLSGTSERFFACM